MTAFVNKHRANTWKKDATLEERASMTKQYAEAARASAANKGVACRVDLAAVVVVMRKHTGILLSSPSFV